MPEGHGVPLIRTGFSLREALRLTRTVGSFRERRAPAEIAGAAGGRGRRLARDLPPDLPLIAKAAPYLNSAAMDGTFEYGLALILSAARPDKSRA